MWLAIAIDPIEIGSQGERLGIVGILIAGMVCLMIGITWIYNQNSKAWKAHHEESIKQLLVERQEFQRERREEREELVKILRECTTVMVSVTKTIERMDTLLYSMKDVNDRMRN
jgi:hypothetical protein